MSMPSAALASACSRATLPVLSPCRTRISRRGDMVMNIVVSAGGDSRRAQHGGHLAGARHPPRVEASAPALLDGFLGVLRLVLQLAGGRLALLLDGRGG